MLQKIKNAVSDPTFKAAVKEVAINVVVAIAVSTAIKAVTYIVVKGSESLIDEIKEHYTTETPAE